MPRGESLDQYLGIGETLMQFRTKNPKTNTLLRTTPLILLLLYLGQRTKYTLPYFKAIYGHFLPTSWSTNKLRSADKISPCSYCITLFIIGTDLHEIINPV